MPLIIDNTQRKFRRELRDELLKMNIPCAVSDTEHCQELLPAFTVFVTEDYIVPDVKYIADMYSSAAVVKVDPEDIPKAAIKRQYSGISAAARRIAQRRIRFDGKELVFCGKTIALTRAQRLLVSVLVLADGWTDAARLAAYCMRRTDDTNSVCVHICNINTKAKNATGQPLILCRRYSGYRI